MAVWICVAANPKISRLSSKWVWFSNPYYPDFRKISDDFQTLLKIPEGVPNFRTLPKIPEDVSIVSEGSWRRQNTSEEGILECCLGVKHNI